MLKLVTMGRNSALTTLVLGRLPIYSDWRPIVTEGATPVAGICFDGYAWASKPWASPVILLM